MNTPGSRELQKQVQAADEAREWKLKGRFSYWPSCSDDGEYIFKFIDAPLLDPDTVLARYPDWQDASLWPTSDKEARSRKAFAERQQDPTTKKGVVGAFCRAYDVPSAIEAFLPGIYAQTDKEDRYTYAAGSTSAGLVVYDDGRFAFSNHGTDPAGGQLCNAFDLVRIHKFGAEDEAVSGEVPTNKRPSYKAMLDFAAADEAVRGLLDKEQYDEAVADFSDDPDPDACGRSWPEIRTASSRSWSSTRSGSSRTTPAFRESPTTFSRTAST